MSVERSRTAKVGPLLLTVFVLGATLARAQRADGIYHIACMVQMVDAANGQKTADCTTHPRDNNGIGIGGKVAFDVTTTHELMDQAGAPEITDFVLFLDGQALPGTYPIVESTTNEPLPRGAGAEDVDSVVTFRVVFPIRRDLSTDKGKENWSRLLTGLGKERKQIPVSIGLINGPPLPSTYKAEFIRVGGARLALFLLTALAISIGFSFVAYRTGVVKDKEPPAPESVISPEQRPYSLSRMQVAIWTLLVIYAYLFIWIVTGEYNTEIPRTILAILGISASTYAAAAAIDTTKQKTQGLTIATKENVVADMFTTESGTSLHRAQFGAWSVVLMIVFIVTVYDTLAMPNLDASLLGLMGVSSAAYAGLKIPERKT